MAQKELADEINSTSSLIQQLSEAFLELETLKDGGKDKLLWKEIQEHYQHLETAMMNQYLELDIRDKVFKEEEFDSHMLLAERESTVLAKEQEMFDQIENLKDAAVAVITEACAKYLPAAAAAATTSDISKNMNGQVSSSSPGGEDFPRPELLKYFEQMDAKGLLNFISDTQTKSPATCLELSIALESATEPSRLVLNSLEGFYPPNEENKNRVLLLEAMATFLAKAEPDPCAYALLLNPEIKQQAKATADEWKPKLADGNSLGAEAFLRLVSTFRVSSEFDEEELCKLVVAVAHTRQAPELCRSLELAHKVPGVVDVLINGGKLIDAAHFIHAFQLSESFPLVPLLKTYLKDVRRNSQGKGSAENDVNAQELAALRDVIRCVQEYKLEADYPLIPLQKRVSQLEKLKPDRKRHSESGRPSHHQQQQFKKPRANSGGFRGFRPGGPTRQQPPPGVYAGHRMGMTERYPQPPPTGGVKLYDYQAPLPSQPAYHPPQPQQGYDQRAYYYSLDNRAPPPPTASTYNAADDEQRAYYYSLDKAPTNTTYNAADDQRSYYYSLENNTTTGGGSGGGGDSGGGGGSSGVAGGGGGYGGYMGGGVQSSNPAPPYM